MKRTTKKGRPRLSPSEYRIRASVAQALGNANRLMILDALAVGEMCVCDIVKMLNCDQSTVSRHLAVLRNAGVVEDRRQGTRIFYRLACPCVTKFFDCIEEVIASQLSWRRMLFAGLDRGAK